MLAPRIGSLFSGAGGLDLAVEHVTGGRTVWHCEADPDAAKVLAAHWPDVPNLGDITAVDWAAVEPVDVLCGGFPCQDVSAAGRRAGIASGTRSGLWLEYAEAINQLRPQLVVIENVRGLLSGYAHRPMEPGPDDLGDRSSRPLLRAAGAVLGDLADLGYDAQWTTVAASDIGAPHRRERVFIVAYPAGSGRPDEQKCSNAQGLDVVAESGPSDRDSARGTAAGIHQLGRGPQELATLEPQPTLQPGLCPHCAAALRRALNGETPLWNDDYCPDPNICDTTVVAPPEYLLPTPTARRYGSNQSPSPGAAIRPGLGSIADLLPTPSVADGMGGHLARSDARSDELLLPTPAARDHKGAADPHREGGYDLYSALALLPTPAASDATGGGQSPDRREGHSRQLIDFALLDGTSAWGKYAPAIRRWEAITREAASPTEPGAKGNPRLAARFSEWMQGWPLGWVTAVPISRSAMLRIIGNGVVPQQAVAALYWLLSVCEVAA
ncbi:phage DNA methylase [Mycobacteroides abscessus subsp. abscessus]|uniref:DNA cytosine methyltransferase n=1 Tax=Mycobacteroides abscessus TaxID=36809 RepID=UPI0009A9021D|nr:DNA (cytosine-5-)-methyltransferase [Mycobacteroides abscessus]SKU47241.1 phage DNA methylase [Mycobacteroides abscessus subsp. abscessus]SKY45221.1 phage DNA methylase [Mycobacteroides abscessus subsp. abscessus]